MEWRTVIRRAALLAAVVGASGFLLGAACPPREWWLAAWVVPGLLLVPTRRLGPGASLLAGLGFAVIFGCTLTGWAFHASLAYFDFNRALAAAFVVLVWLVYGGIPFAALLTVHGAVARRLPAGARPVVGAWLWVASEFLRATLFTGMPWELLGHTQFRSLWLVQVADLGGVYAVSFVVAFVSLSVAELVAAGRSAAASPALCLRRLGPATVVLGAVLAYGAARHAAYPDRTPADARTVAVVQGNVPNAFRWKRAFFEQALATYADLTTSVAAAAPDLIVWPENAVNFYIDQEPLLHAELGEVATLAHEGLIVGGPRLTDDGHAHNSAYLLTPEGAISATYDKQHLVPLAEYVPFRSVTPEPDGPEAYVAGTPADPLRSATLRLGTVICYEALFPQLVRDLVRRGAEVLVNISNDSWMDAGDGGAPAQHFSMVVFRAIETRRYVVRASASGVSGFVSPYGALFSLLPHATAGAAVGKVAPLHEITPYVRWGDRWILLGGLVAGATFLARRRVEAAA